MTDIVDQLRYQAGLVYQDPKVLRKAADEIERLREQRDQLLKRVNQFDPLAR